jgi:hypothetical protein
LQELVGGMSRALGVGMAERRHPEPEPDEIEWYWVVALFLVQLALIPALWWMGPYVAR